MEHNILPIKQAKFCYWTFQKEIKISRHFIHNIIDFWYKICQNHAFPDNKKIVLI